MTNTATIKFRAKRQEYGNGHYGYDVPKIKPSHVTFAERDTVATLLATSRDMGLALTRYGAPANGVVWEDGGNEDEWRRDSSAWTITPLGNGFMADISVTFPLARVR